MINQKCSTENVNVQIILIFLQVFMMQAKITMRSVWSRYYLAVKRGGGEADGVGVDGVLRGARGGG